MFSFLKVKFFIQGIHFDHVECVMVWYKSACKQNFQRRLLRVFQSMKENWEVCGGMKVAYSNHIGVTNVEVWIQITKHVCYICTLHIISISAYNYYSWLCAHYQSVPCLTVTVFFYQGDMGHGAQMADILAGQVKFLPYQPAPLVARRATQWHPLQIHWSFESYNFSTNNFYVVLFSFCHTLFTSVPLMRLHGMYRNNFIFTVNVRVYLLLCLIQWICMFCHRRIAASCLYLLL